MKAVRLATSTLNAKIHDFLMRRTPKSDQVSLGLKNVYVFFSKQGLLFALLLGITFIMGINYANNLVLGLCFYLFGMWLVAVFHTFVQISSLKIELMQTHLTKAGDVAWVEVVLSVKSRQPSRQIELWFEGAEALRLSEVRHGTHVSLSVPTHQRGCMTLPRLCVQTTYPLGILKAWSYMYFKTPIWVYPKEEAFEYEQNILAKMPTDAHTGAVSVGGQEDFERLDTYQAGENLSRVSWVHVARGSGMLTKHFGDPMGSRLSINYHDMPSPYHEQKLSQMVFVLLHMAHTEQTFEFVLPNQPVQEGRGRAFIQACLLSLAKAP